MGILSRIFAKPEDASKVIDGAVKGLDAIFFTKEEKSRANQKLSDWYLKYLTATESQNLARRFIAMVGNDRRDATEGSKKCQGRVRLSRLLLSVGALSHKKRKSNLLKSGMGTRN